MLSQSVADTLGKFIVLVLVGLVLCLKNLHFVWKQFQVAMNDSHHRTPGNANLSPNVWNTCWSSGSPPCITYCCL